MAKVTFDGENKKIVVNQGEGTIDVKIDIYSAWKSWVLDGNTSFLPALRTVGGDPIGNGIKTGDFYFLINGWQIVIGHAVTVNGNIFHDDSIDVFIVNAGGSVISTVSSMVLAVETIVPVVTGDIGSMTQQLDEIQDSLNQTNSLTDSQETMLMEIYQLLGLDPTKPLQVSKTNRAAGDINQNIEVAQDGRTTVTRQ